MGNLFADLQQVAGQQREVIQIPSVSPTLEEHPSITREVTQPRDRSRDIPRGISRDLPSRDDIQEFTFRLRDSFKGKLQAEVPVDWQDELDGLARDLKVKKLELYRFIIGEFLGKVKRSTK